MWARLTARTLEVFHRGKRVAAHVRSSSNRKHTTVREHMPSSHRRYADWTPEHLRRRAGEIGPNTSALVEIILRERAHPEQGFPPASASCGSPRPMAMRASKLPVAAPSTSARAPTARSIRFWRTISIADGLQCPRTGRRSRTTTSVDLPTSIGSSRNRVGEFSG
jgi:hypothetical protein